MSDDPNTPKATSDNFVVASEVMASAIRILALLDLSDREIVDLFEAEAGEGTGLDLSIPVVVDETDARPSTSTPDTAGLPALFGLSPADR